MMPPPPPPPQAMKSRAQNSRLRASNPPQRQPNGGHEKFSRRNTYKGPPPTREDLNARRNTYADEPSETLMVLTKKDGNNRGSPDRRPSAADLDRSVRSARSDGFLPIQVDTDKTKTGRQSMYKRSNSADNLPAMIAMSRQSSRESQPRDKRQSTLGARLSDSVIGQDQNVYDDVLMDLFSSVVASSRENLAFGVAPSLGNSNNSGMKNSRSNAEFDLIRPNRNSFHINSNLEYNPQRIRRGSSSADLVMKSSSLSPSTGKNFNDMLKGSRSTDQLALLASTRKPAYNNNNNMEYNPPSGINAIDKSKRSRSSDQLTLMSSTRKPGYNNNNPETNPQRVRRGSKPSDLLGNPTNQPEMTRSRASSNWLKVLAAIPDHAPAPPLSKQVDQADQKLPRKNSDNRNPGIPRNNSDMMLFQMATQIKGPNDGEGKQTEQNDRPKNRHLKNENNKLKLYDEILSASDPKIGKWIGGPTTQEGTQSTMPSEADPSFLAGSMNKGSRGKGGQSNEMRESRRSRCSLCGQYKKFFIVGLFLLLVGLGVGGYFVFFSASNEASNSSAVSEKDDGDLNTTTRSTTTTTTTTSTPSTESTTRTANEAPSSSKPNEGTVIDPPPSDIEARCSASNLPGSLSACLAACLPSACCYADFTGGSCLDNTACSLYRPYCDVFYDAWIGGTEGVLKDPTDEIVTTCIGTTSANSSGTIPSSHNSSALELSGSSFTVNRLRGHGSRVTSKDTAYDSTRNLLDSNVEACQQYCITAKCCSAPIVTDPEDSGLVQSPTGVFTNASSGEYVMTNCQVTNTKNVPLCAEYQAFCSTHDVTESVPSPNNAGSDLSNVKPSTKPMGPPSSVLPSVTDSMPSLSNPSPSNSNLSSSTSKKPTQDAGNETISTDDSSSISSGTTNATTGGNPSPSQTTVSFSTSRPSSYTQSPNAAPTEFPFVPIPAASAENIQEACASDRATFLIATGDPTARSKCIQACQDGLCCFTDELGYDWMESCYEGNQRLCLDYSACLVLKGVDLQQSVDDNSTETDAHDANSTVSHDNSTTRVDDTDSTEFNSTIDFNDNTTTSGPENPTAGNETESVQVDGPPVPAKDLDLLCSEDSISRPDGLNECIQACRPGKCCGVDDEKGCYKTHAETCILYLPCNSAYNMLNSG
ncbi:hypothetical protein ACHAW6_012728 [Cyclotella cf. meneghiniana]